MTPLFSQLPPIDYDARRTATFLTYQAGLAALAIVPMAIWRFLLGQNIHGVVDVLIVLFLLLLSWLATRGIAIRTIAWLASGIYMVGVWYVVYAFGLSTLLWAFPAGVAMHFILSDKEALLANVLMLAGVWLAGTQIDAMSLTIFTLSFGLVTVFAWQFSNRLRADNALLQRFARLDPLTGVGNRRALDLRVDELLAERHSGCQPGCTMLMIDIDHFKQINDTHGHEVGDAALQQLVGYLGDYCDLHSQIYRFGGEEFCILSAKTLQQAELLAETLRKAVEEGSRDSPQPLTISIGVAQLAPGDSARDWFRRADEALYRAKSSGRNCVQIA